MRFFPFMGIVEGTRRFFDINEPFDPDQLRRVHGQDGLDLIVDGDLRAESITMRVHSAAENGRVLLEVEAPYDPADPWPALQRLMFELTGQLGWHGPVPQLPDWRGVLLGWYLIAKDEQLAVEAEMPCEDPALRLRAACEAYALAPEDAEVGSVLIETCRSMLSRDVDSEAVGKALLAAFRNVGTREVGTAADAALIIEASLGLDAATPVYIDVARTDPKHPTAALKAGFGLYQQGRTAEGRELLRAAYDAGNRDPALRAQLAAAEEECGALGARDQILDDLARESELPTPVARLVASYLVDQGRADEALALLDRVRANGEDHAGLWLERGRALLGAKRVDDSRQALERCLAADPVAEIRAEAKRLLRLTQDGDLLPNIGELEDALRDDKLQLASTLARQLVRQRPELAEAWLLFGVVRQRHRQFRRAERAFTRAIKLQPDLGDGHNRLGVLLAARGKETEGYKHLRKAVELMPHDSSPWLHLAQVCLRLDWRDEAVEAFERAQRIGGHDAEIEQIRALFEESE